MWPFGARKTQTKEELRALTSIDGYWPEAGAGGQAVASVSRALSLVPVFGAVRTLADDIASLTPVLYKRDNKGIPQRQPTPSLFAQPSIHGTLYDWLFRGVVSMALQGDAIGLVTAQDFYGFPTMAEWLNPEQVATEDGKLYGPGSYMNPMWWWWGRPIDPNQLIHIPWFTMPYRVRGVSPIGAYQLSTNIGIGAQEYAANWFGQGGVPPGIFKNAERTIDPADAAKITAQVTSKLQTRKPLVYGRDWDYTPIAIKPHEAEFVSTMQLTATHIAVIYGLPPNKLGGTTGGSLDYSTVELNNIDYLTHSLRPWLRRFEYAFTKCFPRGYYVKFDISEMLLLDARTRADVDSVSLGYQNLGWKDRNEVRTSYDLPPQQAPTHAPTPSDNPKVNGSAVQSVNGSDNNGHDKVSGSSISLSGARSGRQAYLETFRHRWQQVGKN